MKFEVLTCVLTLKIGQKLKLNGKMFRSILFNTVLCPIKSTVYQGVKFSAQQAIQACTT